MASRLNSSKAALSCTSKLLFKSNLPDASFPLSQAAAFESEKPPRCCNRLDDRSLPRGRSTRVFQFAVAVQSLRHDLEQTEWASGISDTARRDTPRCYLWAIGKYA